MILVRVWRRQLVGGIGAATIVPGTLIAALAVLALAGGFARLGALGQVLAGPTAPVASSAIGHGGAPRPLPAALVATLSAAGTPAQPAGGGTAVSRPGNGASPGSSGVPSTAGPPPVVPPGGGGGGGGGGARGPATRSRPSPPPASKPQPTVIDGIVTTGTSVTSQVPGPAGSAATGALQAAGSTVDSIAPIRSP
jgi:hypothetical protein